jgi:AbrB family looped-hinge helix DNA binding protein
MTTTVIIDKAGRIVLPKPVRDALQLSPGDSLELENFEHQIVLRPARGNGRIYKKQGAWVFDFGKPLAANVVNQTIHRVRAE